MIGIRADANDVVATGHIMRCITIAKQLKKLGEEVVFFLADDYGVSMLEENDLDYVVLHTDWAKPIEEIPHLCQEIRNYGVRTMLFDSYRMTKEYFAGLRSQLADSVKMAYIDDLFEDVYPVDVVINYNAYHTQFPYGEAYGVGCGVEQNTGEMEVHSASKQGMIETKLCLGPAYVPLREEFGRSELADGTERSVLMSCGGGDSLQALHGILEKAVKDGRFKDTAFHVIVGRYHQKKELLAKIADAHANVILHHNVSNMAELMEESQIAVSAAGTMLYELCAMERPTVFFITADNQRYDSDFFAEEERMVFAGDLRTDREVCISRVLDGVHKLITNSDMRVKMKEKLRQVTDGNGAQRIAEALLK